MIPHLLGWRKWEPPAIEMYAGGRICGPPAVPIHCDFAERDLSGKGDEQGSLVATLYGNPMDRRTI